MDHMLEVADDLRVMVVDDDSQNENSYRAYLQKHFTVLVAKDVTQAQAITRQRVPDCVITDCSLGVSDGVGLTAELQRMPGMRYVPLILLTGQGAEEIATHAFKSGADDYLSKQNLTEYQLVYAVKSAYLRKRLDEASAAERHSLVQRNLELEKRHRMMTEYWLGIAHTMLTPLASTQEFISLVLDGVSGSINEKQGKYLGYARGGCSTIEAAVMRLVKMADLSADPGELHWRAEPLIPMLEEALDEIRIEGKRLGVEIETQYHVQPEVFGERNALVQLVHLLLQRCLWYAAQTGRLTLNVVEGADPDLVQIVLEGSTQSECEPLQDQMDWQLKAALSQANGSDFNVTHTPGVVQFQFQMLKGVESLRLVGA